MSDEQAGADRPDAGMSMPWRFSSTLDLLHWGIGIAVGKVFRVFYVAVTIGPWTVRLSRGMVALA